MGTYLSTPVLEKGQESGDDLECPVVPLSWGVVDMQGWRKSMEDSHVAQTNVQGNGNLKVFGVFDGHGGPEVARFCQLYLVDVLLHQKKNEKEEPFDDDTIGPALVDTFHALDRMIDQHERRDELVQLRSDKPGPGEQREIGSIPIPPPKPVAQLEHPLATPQPTTLPAAPSMTEESIVKESTTTPEERIEAEEKENEAEEKERSQETEAEEKEEETANENSSTTEKATVVAPEDDPAVEASADNDDDDETDSQEAVGQEEAARLDQDDDKEDDPTTTSSDIIVVEEIDDSPAADPKSKKVGGMFKFLTLHGNKGQAVVKAGSEQAIKHSESPKAAKGGPATIDEIQPFRASIMHNGRQICNLRDHPIHAGATAVVAVLLDRTLTVANAGDSRAVLCRAGGKTEPLSYDHKPQQDREISRIRKAGGFVNQFGRINGNLNLSRSIGDLKYKQVPGIPPAEQMITAEPDIIQTTLHPKDEFIIIGCDGIWDCLTNEQAVDYVLQRIDTKTPTEIGAEMLDDIVSEDPRSTQGIGGDNMTILIVDLQPEKRSYH